ncbi:Dgp-1 [Aphelenchoides bicaudatus]|nr:Dgp-1 [Aphelenchoides bicaudatus]
MEELEPETSALTNRFLIDKHQDALERYEEYLRGQLANGEGETLVELGLPLDDEYEDKGKLLSWTEAEKTNQAVAKKLNCVTTALLTKSVDKKFSRPVIVRKNFSGKDFIEVRVAVVGNVDAGKSTFLGVLTHNALDDGRGHARKRLFRHKHEFETGRTSSVGNDILGFNASGQIVNKPDPHSGKLDWVEISTSASKIITFIDLAGHEKYLKTTIFGLTGYSPDYTMLMVGANMGIAGMTREHLSLCLALNVPVFVVITKIDRCPAPVLEETLKQLNKLLRSPGSRKSPILINNIDDLYLAAQNFYGGKVCPIFKVSNVTGENLDFVRSFLNILPLRRPACTSDKVHFVIDEIFHVTGVGTVISGNCLSGTINTDDILWLGPDTNGAFIQVKINSIHRKRLPVDTVHYGQSAAFAIKKISKKQVRKGMVLLSGTEQPKACWEFEAEILILNHPTTISKNYEAMIHAGAVRQTAKILQMNKEVLRTGDRDKIHFKFTRRPEYIVPGTRLVFREGLTKAVGAIHKILVHATPLNAPKGPSDAKKYKHLPKPKVFGDAK